MTMELVFIPSPGIGHLRSTVELAKQLVNGDERLSITVIIIPRSSAGDADDSAQISSLFTPSQDRLRHETISVSVNPTGERPPTQVYIANQKPQVRDAVARLLDSPSSSPPRRLAAFVIDMFCISMMDVADEFGVPTYMVYTSNASFLGFSLHLQEMYDEKKCDTSELSESVKELEIPCFTRPYPVECLPYIFVSKEWLPLFLAQARNFRKMKGILVNTVAELEAHALNVLSRDGGGVPRVYPIGPVLHLENGEKEPEILRWLDDQPARSVVFLCFGSLGGFSDEQTREIAVALDRSGQRFLWSLRRASPNILTDAETEKAEEDVAVTKDEGQAEATSMEEDADGKKEKTDDGVSGGGTVEDAVMEENVESKDSDNAKADEKQETGEADVTETDNKKAGKESEGDVKDEGEKANGTKQGNTGDIKEEEKLVDGDKGTEKIEEVETVDEKKKEDNEEDMIDEGKEEEGKEEDKTEEVEVAKETVEDEEEAEGSKDENGDDKVETGDDKEDDKEAEKAESGDEKEDDKEAEKAESGDDKEDDKEAEKAESGDDKEDEKEESKGSKKRGKGKAREKTKSEAEKKDAEPKTPYSDRPVRERKSVERLVAVIDKDSSKEFHIEKGQGVYLKDIPSVAYKVTRKKSDEILKVLHQILFARRGKAAQIKTNILGFSGFVWHGKEEKAREKIKEKLDKCNKEKLWEFCDVFDIHVSKATTKKEDIVTKLIEFLEKPHGKGDVPASEKDKSSTGAKRKRTPKQSSSAAGSSSSKRSAKSKRKSGEGTKAAKKILADSEDESEEEKEEEEKEENADEENENENGIPDKSEDEAPQPSESEEKDEPEEDSEEETPKKKKRGSKVSAGKKESAGRARTKKAAVAAKSSPPEKVTQKRSSAKRKKTDDDSDTSPKASSKRKKSEKVTKASAPSKSSASKEKPEVKSAGKGKEKTKGPSDKVLKKAIVEILKRVDFNTATFTDILKELAKEFKEDLTPRKSFIKLMIQSELTKLAEEVDEQEEEEEEKKEDDAEKEKAGGSAGAKEEEKKEDDAEKEKAGVAAGTEEEKKGDDAEKEKAGGSSVAEEEKKGDDVEKEKAGGSAVAEEKKKGDDAEKEKAGGSAVAEEVKA